MNDDTVILFEEEGALHMAAGDMDRYDASHWVQTWFSSRLNKGKRRGKC